MTAVAFRLASRAPQRAALVWALLAALWFASTLGLVHRTLHGLPAATAVTAVTAAVAPSGTTGADAGGARIGEGARGTAQAAPAEANHASLLATLFGQHSAGGAECRLYDQLAHGAAAPCVPLVVLPMVLPQATFDYFLGEALVRWVALFDARGPPVSR